jgi:peptidyl-prolyl cis-trans isomerase C
MNAAITVGGVPVVLNAEELDAGERRQRVCTELLRQAAKRAGLLAADDPAPLAGAISDAASTAIETLLDQALPSEEPDEAACRRHFEAHTARHAIGERLLLRHVLFAITPGLDLAAMRRRAEACLIELRAAQTSADDADPFATVASQWSNCPSGAEGGALGWLRAEDCAEEFARGVFGATEVGVLPRLVTSRHGLHVVEVLAREPGRVPAFEEVRGAVALALAQQRFATELRRYLDALAAEAAIEGLDFEATTA